jgi:hypothetical protein
MAKEFTVPRMFPQLLRSGAKIRVWIGALDATADDGSPTLWIIPRDGTKEASELAQDAAMVTPEGSSGFESLGDHFKTGHR